MSGNRLSTCNSQLATCQLKVASWSRPSGLTPRPPCPTWKAHSASKIAFPPQDGGKSNSPFLTGIPAKCAPDASKTAKIYSDLVFKWQIEDRNSPIAQNADSPRFTHSWPREPKGRRLKAEDRRLTGGFLIAYPLIRDSHELTCQVPSVRLPSCQPVLCSL